MIRLLLLEDDQSLARSLQNYLFQNGFQVDCAGTIKEAQQILSSAHDLLILDWMLPDGEGIDFLKKLRRINNQIPIIVLTARADLVDKVLGLESGANDYLTKPFEPRELIARIRTRMRELSNSKSDFKTTHRIDIGPFSLDPNAFEAHYLNKKLELTRMEFALLQTLISHPNRVFTREELLNKVWGFNKTPTTRTVDTHMLMLRSKSSEEFFETVRGIGYKFVFKSEI